MRFTGGSTADTATRLDARHQAEVRAWWRDWQRYLQAQLQLLAARQAEATQPPSFERSEAAWEQQRAEAEQTLRRIPHERRIVFDRTRDARRVELQAALDARQRGNGAAASNGLDPEVVERDALSGLLDEAEGRADGQDGWGKVPMPPNGYELQVAALLHAPNAAEYAVAAEERDEVRSRLVMLGALLLVGAFAVWWTWPRGMATAAQGSAATAVQVNGEPATAWPIVAVALGDGAAARVTLAVTPTDALAWPAAPQAGAWWRRTVSAPLQLCVPRALLATARTLEVQSGGDAPLRSYTLRVDRPARPDLELTPCAPADDTPPRYGQLERVTARPDQPLDRPAKVGATGPELRVEAIDVIGAAQDPALPADSARVVVRVRALTTVTWPALDPRLVLQTGQELLPAAPITTDAGERSVEVAYLTPAFTTTLDVAWSITDPATGVQLRWRTRLDPPQSRADVLRESLELRVNGTRGPEPNAGALELELRNTSGAAVVLRNDDVAILQQDRTLPVVALGTAGMAIRPREVRTLELPLRGVDWTQDIRVRVGSAHFRFERQ